MLGYLRRHHKISLGDLVEEATRRKYQELKK